MTKQPESELNIKLASEEWEFEQIHRLNYRTFAEEIPQHAPNAEKRLVDRYHAENTYVIALQQGGVIGMLALRGARPFSLDAKLPDLDRHLPQGCVPVEVRLLAVEPGVRKTAVFSALLEFALKHGLKEGYDVAVISGTTRQLKLYRHLGFTPFGPLVGTAEAAYQPMYLTLESYRQVLNQSAVLRKALNGVPDEYNELNFLPGPVWISPQVRQAFEVPCMSHRGSAFLSMMARVRERLCQMTGARDAQVVLGSGTLGNEIVAAQLSLSNIAGLILSNGEFGRRLVANARRARLTFDEMPFAWGTRFDLDEIARAMSRLPQGGWVWMVHHETSTGLINPLEEVKALCARFGLRLCVDCISSVGAMPVNLDGVHLATCVSGKGLGAYPGLAVVFHNYAPMAQPERLPGYMDLGCWSENRSVPYTHSSNLLNAFLVAIERATPQRMARIGDNMTWLCNELAQNGLPPLISGADASPAVVTVAPEEPGMAAALGDELEMRGYWLSYRSGYLLERNWIQIALLGDPPRPYLEKLVRVIGMVYGRLRSGREYTPAVRTRDAIEDIRI